MESSMERQPFRAAAAAFMGAAIEWYDLFCYAAASSLVFGEIFFSTGDRFVGAIASLGTFAAGFVARPFGAILFGYIGDKVGRRHSLVITLIMMGAASTLIGVLPTYQSVGLMAPVLLVILRLVQGVAVGGEWGGAILIAAEHAPRRWRTFLAAAPQYGNPVGLIGATTAFQIMSTLPEADFKAWGWRIPFLASALLMMVAFLIRRGVNESPEFSALQNARKTRKDPSASDQPLRRIIAEFKGRFAIGVGLSVLGIAGFYFVTTLMIAITTTYLQIEKSDILRIINYTGFVQLAMFPVGCFIAHRIGERRFLVLVSIATLLWSAPMMMLVLTRDLQNIAIAVLVTMALTSGYYAVLASFLPKAFPVDIRYTGVSLSYQVCGAVFGGTTPLVGLWIVQMFGLHWAPLALMFAVITGCTLIAALVMPVSDEATPQDIEAISGCESAL